MKRAGCSYNFLKLFRILQKVFPCVPAGPCFPGTPEEFFRQQGKILTIFLTAWPKNDNINKLIRYQYAPVAQLDRVFGYEPKGRGFESLLAHQKSTVFTVLFLFLQQSP